MRLYDLTEQYNDLLDLLEDNPDNESLQAMLEGMEDVIEDKVENIVKIIKTLEGEAKVIAEEVTRLQQRKAAVEANKSRLKEYTEDLLNRSGLDKLKGKLFNVWMQNNPPSVNVIDESAVPKEYFATKVELQKKAILEAWKNGELVPGAEISQGRSLRVR